MHKLIKKFNGLDFARILVPDQGPEGRLAVFLYEAEDGGFVWVEPGYQDPFDATPSVRYHPGPLDCIEAVGEDTECFMYWLEHCIEQGRNTAEERQHVLDNLLGGTFNGHKLS